MSTQKPHTDVIAVLLITAKLGSKRNVLQEVNEQTNCGPSRTMECYAVIKTNELLSYKKTWGDLESIL